MFKVEGFRAEQAELSARVPRRVQQVEQAVAVEVLDDRAAREAVDGEPPVPRDLGEARELVVLGEARRGHAEGLGHRVGVRAERRHY